MKENHSTVRRYSPIALRGPLGSTTLAMNERVHQMWDAGRQVYHLGFGESRFPVHPSIAETLRVHATQQSYLPVQGLRSLRERVADFYAREFGVSVSPERVIVGPGSKALLYALLHTLEGDLLLPTPSWVSYHTQALLVGKRVHRIPGSPTDGYRLRVNQLRLVIKQQDLGQHHPGILLLNSPNNPTGRMLDPETLDELADVCRERRLVALSDEIYALVQHGQKSHESIARYCPEQTVILGGLSKQLSLGGWRLGVAIVPPSEAGDRLIHALCAVASEIWSAVASPVQYAAVVAYDRSAEISGYIQECARIHTIRTQHLFRALVDMGVSCSEPNGAFYLFPNFDRWREPLVALGVRTSDDLAKYLLDRYGLATLAGSVFGTPPDELSLRLSSSYLDMETNEQAQALLDAYRADPDAARLIRDHHPSMRESVTRFRGFVKSLERD